MKLNLRFINKKQIIGTAHFLVVKDEKYINAARIGIKSFLACNWEYKVEIHTDEALVGALNVFIDENKFNEIVSISMISTESSWKSLKFELLISMQGTYDLYIDADTRCNGKIPRVEEVICFVNEGEVLQTPSYRSILAIFDPTNLRTRKFMLNTSYFSWGGNTLPSHVIPIDLFNAFERHLAETEVSRLSEQIMISLLVQNFFPDFRSLKASDYSFDRGIIESSYLGTTGRQIYRR